MPTRNAVFPVTFNPIYVRFGAHAVPVWSTAPEVTRVYGSGCRGHRPDAIHLSVVPWPGVSVPVRERSGPLALLAAVYPFAFVTEAVGAREYDRAIDNSRVELARQRFPIREAHQTGSIGLSFLHGPFVMLDAAMILRGHNSNARSATVNAITRPADYESRAGMTRPDLAP